MSVPFLKMAVPKSKMALPLLNLARADGGRGDFEVPRWPFYIALCDSRRWQGAIGRCCKVRDEDVAQCEGTCGSFLTYVL